MTSPSLDGYLEQFEEDTDRLVKELQERGKSERKKILADVEQQLASAQENMLSRVKTSAEGRRRQELSSAELEVQKARLNIERALMEEVYSKTRERIEAMSGSERSELLGTLVRAVASFDGATLHPAAVDSSNLTPGGGQSLGEAIDGLGGFRLQSADGSVAVDLRFDELLELAWEKNTNEISKELFGS